VALRRMGDDREMYRFMYDEVITGQAKAFLELQSAVARADWQVAKRLAHTLKGLAGTLGAHSLMVTAEMLERCCAKAGPETAADCQPLLLSIEAALVRLAVLASHPAVLGQPSSSAL